MAKHAAHAAIHYRRVVLHTLLSLATALLLLGIFPKFDFRFLAPVALTPLLVALARTPDGWQRFIFGWAAGIFYWFFLCTWIQFVLQVHGGMGIFGSWGSFVLFSVLKALHLAVFSLLAGPLMKQKYAIPAVAALWTGLERTHATFGFAWLDLGNAGITMSVPLRVAPFVGVYGVSFIFCMLAAALACVILRFPRSRLIPLAALGVLFFLPAIPENIPTTESALVVQPNINPDLQWTQLLEDKTEQELSVVSDAFRSKLVIWPELPAPLYYYDDPDFHRAATDDCSTPRLLPIRNRRLHVATPTTQFGRAAWAGWAGDRPLDKINLVPFGEFVPPIFSFVNRITQEAGDFVPGHDIKVLPAAGHRLGVFICYESAFPDLVRQFSNKRRERAGELVKRRLFRPFGSAGSSTFCWLA